MPPWADDMYIFLWNENRWVGLFYKSEAKSIITFARQYRFYLLIWLSYTDNYERWSDLFCWNIHVIFLLPFSVCFKWLFQYDYGHLSAPQSFTELNFSWAIKEFRSSFGSALSLYLIAKQCLCTPKDCSQTCNYPILKSLQ